MKPPPTVFIVDDDPAVGDALGWLTQSLPGVVVRTYTSGQDFLKDYDPGQPGCVVLDVRLGDMDGLDLHEQMKAGKVALPVIFISGYADVPMAVRALKAGAVDFLEKPIEPQALLNSIRQALDRDASNRSRQAQLGKFVECLQLLTWREREVLDLLVAGKSSKMIASRLGISVKTVEVHRSKIMAKTKAENVAELVRLVLLADPP